MSYKTYVGCEEWQDTRECPTLYEAEQWMLTWQRQDWTMGLYSATDAWIEFPDGTKREYETGHKEITEGERP